jgi:hypothetical protein
MDRIINSWLPLTFAVNSINRSMGQPDLYSFVLSPAVISKLAFLHYRIRCSMPQQGSREREEQAEQVSGAESGASAAGIAARSP